MALQVHYQNKNFRLRNSKEIRNWLNLAILDLGLNPGTISFIFTDDIFLREINRKFLEHDYYTDVITFNLSEQEGLLDGEIYISTETVKSNSITYGTAFDDEIKRVMVHGILHLAGYMDDTDDQREEMREMENRYLEKF